MDDTHPPIITGSREQDHLESLIRRYKWSELRQKNMHWRIAVYLLRDCGLTIEEAADKVRISTSTMQNYRRELRVKGTLPSGTPPGQKSAPRATKKVPWLTSLKKSQLSAEPKETEPLDKELLKIFSYHPPD